MVGGDSGEGDDAQGSVWSPSEGERLIRFVNGLFRTLRGRVQQVRMD